MKRIDGWLTLAYATFSALLLTLALVWQIQNTMSVVPVIAAGLCWGFGYLWFAALGWRARKKKRIVYAAAFLLLCACLLLGLVLCGFLLFFADNA